MLIGGLLVWSTLIALKARYSWATAPLLIGTLAHEAALIYGTPLVFVIWFLDYRVGRASVGSIVRAAGLLGLVLLIIATGYLINGDKAQEIIQSVDAMRSLIFYRFSSLRDAKGRSTDTGFGLYEFLAKRCGADTAELPCSAASVHLRLNCTHSNLTNRTCDCIFIADGCHLDRSGGLWALAILCRHERVDRCGGPSPKADRADRNIIARLHMELNYPDASSADASRELRRSGWPHSQHCKADLGAARVFSV